MTVTINGLHSCKPENAPREGDVKTFVIEQKTGKSGKPYLKIKSAGAEYGGTPHRILSAERTDYVDGHGNISFNLEVEAVNGAAPAQTAFAGASGIHNAPPASPAPRQHGGMSKDDYWTQKARIDAENKPRIERQHSQEMAIRWFALVGQTPSTELLRDMTSWFQQDIGYSPNKTTAPFKPSPPTYDPSAPDDDIPF